MVCSFCKDAAQIYIPNLTRLEDAVVRACEWTIQCTIRIIIDVKERLQRRVKSCDVCQCCFKYFQKTNNLPPTIKNTVMAIIA
jgi:hypothetical protein